MYSYTVKSSLKSETLPCPTLRKVASSKEPTTLHKVNTTESETDDASSKLCDL